jgi:hypothetical protein
MRAYVERTASSQIDSDVDFAALDYHTVAAPSGGPGTVLWASSGGAEVDWARQAAALAGRVPVLVEPRACSLANAYVFNHEPEDGRASLLLHSGARWLTLALVLDGLLLYSRDVATVKQHQEETRVTLNFEELRREQRDSATTEADSSGFHGDAIEPDQSAAAKTEKGRQQLWREGVRNDPFALEAVSVLSDLLPVVTAKHPEPAGPVKGIGSPN